MNDEPDDVDVLERAPPPWGAEITPLTEVCGGQYVLLHEIARGDLSIVYRAKPAGTRDVIAFKLVQPRYVGDQAQVRRFRREAELLRRIEHPNVVRLIDHGTIEDGRDFVALELLTGRTLADALAKATRMSPERTCRIARQVARALRAMHKVGVIHRDLRPENILLIGPEDAERVKLVDFSDAGDVGAPARRVKDQPGQGSSGPHDQPSYRAPEQVQKRPPQPSMDVFALGVIMYEMLAGEHPFVQPAPGGPKLGGHTIRTKAFDAPEVLLGLVADCIERDPDERPRSMDDVLDRIDKALLWMGVVPREGSAGDADEDRRTQLWTAADDKGGAAKRKGPPVRAEAAPRAEAVAEDDELEFDLEDGELDETAPAERRPNQPEPRGRKPWESVKADDVEPRRAAASDGRKPWESVAKAGDAEPRRSAAPEPAKRAAPAEGVRPNVVNKRAAPAEGVRPNVVNKRAVSTEGARPSAAANEEARRAQEAQRRAREEEAKARAQEETRRAQEEARRAQEEARRAQEEARRAQEDARRAQGDARRAQARRDGASTGSVPRIDLDELRERERASRDEPSSGSAPRIDLDELREREDGRRERSRDESSSGSMPRIDIEDLDDGAPTGPRFVVDTVAWTKQQPSAEPTKGRKSRVEADEANGRGSAAREPTGGRASTNERVPRVEPASASQRSPQVERAAGSQRAPAGQPARPRPPTAAHHPVDTLPRWLMLLVMLILAVLAYAAWLVWTQ